MNPQEKAKELWATFWKNAPKVVDEIMQATTDNSDYWNEVKTELEKY